MMIDLFTAVSMMLVGDQYQYVLPNENYKHWTVLAEVCETRRQIGDKPVTYGANEFVKSGSGTTFVICRWKYVPYNPNK
jgi:hypothetical protein